MSQPLFVGIDVAKDTVEVACSDASSHSFTNNEAGHAKLLRWLARKSITLIVLEATGGYEQACAVALAAAGLPVSVLNPRQARDFARAMGKGQDRSHRRCRAGRVRCSPSRSRPSAQAAGQHGATQTRSARGQTPPARGHAGGRAPAPGCGPLARHSVGLAFRGIAPWLDNACNGVAIAWRVNLRRNWTPSQKKTRTPQRGLSRKVTAERG